MTSIRKCPICDQQKAEILFKPRSSPGPVSKCVHCGMVYISIVEDDRALIFDGPVIDRQAGMNILTSSSLDDVRDSWEFSLLPDKESELPAIYRNSSNALRRIERHIKNILPGQKILDFGSGWGFFLSVAKEHGFDAYGLEPLPASSVYARVKYGLNITVDTLRENTFPPDFFDVITSFQVFEHLPYPKNNIQILHKMLRQDGIILIEVPNFRTWTMQILKSKHRHFVQDHINFFSDITLGKLLTNAGFKVIEWYYPTRRMSVRHLVEQWLPQYLPKSMVDVLRSSIQMVNLWNKAVGMNIGDIVAVIAQKL